MSTQQGKATVDGGWSPRALGSVPHHGSLSLSCALVGSVHILRLLESPKRSSAPPVPVGRLTDSLPHRTLPWLRHRCQLSAEEGRPSEAA